MCESPALNVCVHEYFQHPESIIPRLFVPQLALQLCPEHLEEYPHANNLIASLVRETIPPITFRRSNPVWSRCVRNSACST